ncbi:CGNR zinc finger domain-containing protein [Porticoccaceae bacterium LTM1]|nr:CGNR zinc finger domain-containing protein [Porticoccaceae bacterium LTM1]
MSVRGIDHLKLVGGNLALDFTNTVHDRAYEKENDELQSFGCLVEWTQKAGAINEKTANALKKIEKQDPQDAEETLQRAREFRRLLYKVFLSFANGDDPDQQCLDKLRDSWLDAMKNASLSHADSGCCWVFNATPDSLDSILAPIAYSAIRLITGPDIRRVRMCGANDCTWMFVDSSKNRSRRWCQMEVCGNRAKAKRHYHKSC